MLTVQIRDDGRHTGAQAVHPNDLQAQTCTFGKRESAALRVAPGWSRLGIPITPRWLIELRTANECQVKLTDEHLKEEKRLTGTHRQILCSTARVVTPFVLLTASQMLFY